MSKIYFVLAVFAALFFAYLAGISKGVQKCQKDVAYNNVKQQMELIQAKEQVNAETVTVGTGVIRERLYQKYTIAD
ncbi:MAG: hypothetical protein IKZ34_02415 [Alphaproteobacteria bacterium]|nr:hypothetical protein [Alphaproteobacteria bacterium]